MRRVLVALVLGGVACGSSSGDTSVCDALATAATDVSTKAAPCSLSPQLGFTADECRASISKCTDSDQQKIKDYTSCLHDLPACTPATSQSWSSSLGTCEAKLDGLAGQGGC